MKTSIAFLTHIRSWLGGMFGRTSRTRKLMAGARRRVAPWPWSIPALCLSGVSYFGGWAAGQLPAILTHPIALICGSVVWLIALAFAFAWLESRVRTALEAMELE